MGWLRMLWHVLVYGPRLAKLISEIAELIDSLAPGDARIELMNLQDALYSPWMREQYLLGQRQRLRVKCGHDRED